ncbi:hypothetical protein OFP91_14665 [Brachyspira hyodysenteriae]|uniref:hypothetical protein n=1 Tax=Brachyspira hyodysenteriae TaxID=159 RepID=UPI0022CDAC8C|nr:hypothetical protein [Brachyspira hyodysenteriae]MCZ9899280.1 hypothetical protein [Brachyspira hyodysenteriae]
MTEINKSIRKEKDFIYSDENNKEYRQMDSRIQTEKYRRTPRNVKLLEANDFQNQKLVYIKHYVSCNNFNHALNITITDNLIPCSAYIFAVRHCIKADWINDRDQFLYPNESWKEDKEFHSDCLSFYAFSSSKQNNI